MEDLNNLDKSELIRLLRESQKALTSDAREEKTLLHDLQSHQIELELQNRELREVQQALELTRDRYADLYDFAPVGYLTLDGRGVISEVNLTASSLLGIPRRELLGWPLGSYVAKASKALFFIHLKRSLVECDANIVSEIELKLRDGGSRHVRLESIAAVADNGEPVSRTAMVDISARKQAEDSVLISEERLRNAQKFANVGTWDWDIQTGHLFWTERISALFGYREGALDTTYENFINAIHPDDRQSVIDAVNASVEHGENYEIEHRIFWPDGALRWVFEQGSVTRDCDGNPLRMLGMVQDITRRKEAESALRESEKRLKQAQRMGRLGNWSLDVASGKLFSSDEIYRIFGYQPGEFEPSYERFIETVHPEDIDKLKQLEKKVFSKGHKHKHSVDHRIILPDGNMRWVHEGVEAIFDELGEVVQIQGTVQDITERKLAETERRKDHKLMQLVTETQNDYLHGYETRGIFKKLLQGILDLVDSEYGFITQVFYTSEGSQYLKSVAITDLTWNDETWALFNKYETRGMDSCNMETLFGRTLTTGRPVISNNPANDKYAAGLPPGHPPINSYLGLPFFLGRKMIGMISIANRPGGYNESIIHYLEPALNACAYIFDRIAAEKTLKESEAKYRGLVNSSMDAVTLCDGKYFVDVNPAGLELFGFNSKEEFYRYPPTDLSPAVQPNGRDSQELAEEMIKRAVEQGSHRYEWLHKRLDGSEFLTEISLSSVELNGQQMIQADIRDISARKQAEKENELLQKTLLQSQKMEALGLLTGGIAHDFNNILTVIMGYAELGLELEDDFDRDEVRSYLSEVSQAGVRARCLISQMLAFSRSDANERELRLVELSPLLDDAVKMLRPIFPSTIDFHCQVEESMLVVTADPVHIHQIIMNLCINARDAVGEHGSIELKLRLAHDEDGVCASCLAPVKGKFVEISVRDSGGGIEPDKLTQIFEPFYTTKEVGKGTGMGLSVIHGIMHRLGGHILVDSRTSEGAEFRLLFPLAADVVKADMDEGVETASPKYQGNNKRVLVVDDEIAVANFLAILLEKRGFQVEKFSDSEAALAHFSAQPDGFDLVITDQTMPNMTGLELSRAILDIKPAMPIVICTGYSQSVNEKTAKVAGIKGYLKKPLAVNTLLEMIEPLLV